jgi:hypothetical protein
MRTIRNIAIGTGIFVTGLSMGAVAGAIGGFVFAAVVMQDAVDEANAVAESAVAQADESKAEAENLRRSVVRPTVA